MTAALRIPKNLHAPFLAIVPDLTRFACSRFRFYSPDAREEAGAEAVAHAWALYVGLVNRGRPDVIQRPGFIINSVHPVAGGRLAGGYSSTTETLSRHAQHRGGFSVASLAMPRPGGGLLEGLIEDRHTNPADLAIFRVDFAAWLARQSPRHRRMMKQLARGERGTTVAARFKLSRPRISQLRSAWRRAWAEFQGEPGPAVA